MDSETMLKTPLYDWHVAYGAKMVPFAGWLMPIHYGSQIDEHHCVRNDKGMFDVSHMLAVDLKGERVESFLGYLVANDVRKIKPGKALYTCMLNEKGGVIDDLIIYYLSEHSFRLVVNAGNRSKDVNWIKEQAQEFGVSVSPREDLSIIAVQGPGAREAVVTCLDDQLVRSAAELKPFSLMQSDEMLIARTGYTGEDGFEIMLPQTEALDFWKKLAHQGVEPCGLGARDTLRLEAGLNLYGNDMTDDVTPFECGLSWTVTLTDDRNFIGKEALVQQKEEGVKSQFVGLILTDKGVLRAGQTVVTDQGNGITTSGTFSPTLKESIALARIPVDAHECKVEIRGRTLSTKMVTFPFVRRGKVVFKSMNNEVEMTD